jgi:hypothetical protein
LHADAGHALLTGVLHAIGVAVFEHAVAQVGRGRWRGRRRRRWWWWWWWWWRRLTGLDHQAGIEVGHRVAAFQRHRAALAGAAVGVAVEGVAHAAVCRA